MLAPGQIARKLLGRHFQPVGDIYRRLFVDLDRIVDFFERELPHGAKVLDIGGGDGALVDRLLTRRPDLAVTMCDLAPHIGSFLSDDHRRRVVQFPATSFTEVPGEFDVVTIADVIHHVPVEQRDAFFTSLAESCGRWNCRKIVFKDVEPRGARALLALLADRYVTGDRHVVFMTRSRFAALTRQHFPNAKSVSAMPDRPNYCEALSW